MSSNFILRQLTRVMTRMGVIVDVAPMEGNWSPVAIDPFCLLRGDEGGGGAMGMTMYIS